MSDRLMAMALAGAQALKHTRSGRWCLQRQTSRVRKYVCALCGLEIDRESSQYKRTKHAAQAIEMHAIVCPKRDGYLREGVRLALKLTDTQVEALDTDTLRTLAEDALGKGLLP